MQIFLVSQQMYWDAAGEEKFPGTIFIYTNPSHFTISFSVSAHTEHSTGLGLGMMQSCT